MPGGDTAMLTSMGKSVPERKGFGLDKFAQAAGFAKPVGGDWFLVSIDALDPDSGADDGDGDDDDNDAGGTSATGIANSTVAAGASTPTDTHANAPTPSKTLQQMGSTLVIFAAMVRRSLDLVA